MKVKVMREIVTRKIYYDIIDFNIEKDDVLTLDEDLTERNVEYDEDQTWFLNPDTDKPMDLHALQDNYNKIVRGQL
jgi:hypothetical protein